MEFLRRPGQRRPDLILLDLNLPGMDGREVLAEIKADPALSVIPVVILTTSRAEEDIVCVRISLHANCYVTKPVDLNQFMRVVQSIEEFWFSGRAAGSERGAGMSTTRVLLVEDEPGYARFLREVLARGDGEHVSGHLGRNARRRARASRGDPFDIVLLDLGLPDADGTEALRRSRRPRRRRRSSC